MELISSISAAFRKVLFNQFLFRNSRLIWIFRIITPFEPSAVVNRNAWSAHQPSIVKGFAASSACPAIKSKMLIRSNSNSFPLLGNFMKFSSSMIIISVICSSKYYTLSDSVSDDLENVSSTGSHSSILFSSGSRTCTNLP